MSDLDEPHRWLGRATGSGSATTNCKDGPTREERFTSFGPHTLKECPGAELTTTASIRVDDQILLDDDEEVVRGVILRSDAPRISSGPAPVVRPRLCRFLVEEFPGGESRTRRSTVDTRYACPNPDSTSFSRVPWKTGSYEVYRDASGTSVTTVRLQQLSGGCGPTCDAAAPCLRSRCHDVLGCIIEGVEGSCQPANRCATGRCLLTTGICVEGAPMSCGGGDACNAVACDPAVGCLTRPLPDGTPCPGSHDLCETAPACVNGACAPPAPITGWVSGDPHDCHKTWCQDGVKVRTVPDDSEVPAQWPNMPCEKQVCQGGGVVTEADLAEIPPQELHNCNREICGPYGVEYRSDPMDLPVQRSTSDCMRQVCITMSNGTGEIEDVPDKSEVPAVAGTFCCGGTFEPAEDATGTRWHCVGEGKAERMEPYGP
jgi:hypothetical protein